MMNPSYRSCSTILCKVEVRNWKAHQNSYENIYRKAHGSCYNSGEMTETDMPGQDQ